MHREQRRKNKSADPYINHPVGVMEQLKEYGVTDLRILFAALGHDLIEDTSATYDEIVKLSNKEVGDIIMECTDDKSLPKERRKELQIENASHKSVYATLVKLSDKMYNLRDLAVDQPVGWSLERIRQYFIWAETVINALPDYQSHEYAPIIKIMKEDLKLLFAGSFMHEGAEYKIHE
jgi:guanosine-3',5'-bis(diphosphate) 3'-pyrophosphohydrolase